MHHLDFSLKIISPAFVAGTMEKEAHLMGRSVKHRLIEHDGLRVPSLRGVLRFWFRAMEGIADTELLWKKESDIFGSTDSGQGLRIIPVGQTPWTPLVIGGEKDKIRGGDPLAYLGYGPLNYVNKEVGVSSHNKSIFRDAIPEGTVFNFRAVGKREQIDTLKNCLRLLHLFGGIGSRSRRAWGSLAVGSDIFAEFNAGDSVTDWFEKVLKQVWPNGLGEKNHLPGYSAFSTHTQVRISHPLHTYLETFQEFHKQFKRTRIYDIFRPSNSPRIAFDDHELEAKDSKNRQNISGVPLRIAFGMPYHPQSQKNRWDIEYLGYSTSANGGKLDRRASPLILKVLEGPDNRFYAVSLFLKAHFFGKSGIEIGRKEGGNTLPFPGWKAVNEFMQNKDWQSISLP